MKPVRSDLNVIERFEPLLCEECKMKLAQMAQHVRKIDMLLPRRVTHKFMRAICNDCRRALRAELRNTQGRK